MAKKYTQTQQVIDTLRKNGGYATLGKLYHLVDTSNWRTKTPNEYKTNYHLLLSNFQQHEKSNHNTYYAWSRGDNRGPVKL